jgi:protein O-GlcNAc transferase
VDKKVSTTVADNEAFRRAVAALQAGNLNDAERLFKAILRSEPRHVAALNLLGIVLTRLGKLTEAETYLLRALQERTDSDATFHNYGVVLKALNRPAEAVERFSQALAINPASAETWNNRGTAFNDLKLFDEALADFEKAIQIDPRYVQAHYDKGKSLLALSRVNEAVAAFDRALALRPDLLEAEMGRGYALGQLGHHDEALAAHDRALALRPKFAILHCNRAAALLNLKRYAEALASCDRAISLAPNLVLAHGNRGDALLNLERYSEALSSFDHTIALEGRRADGWLGRGNVLTKLKRYDDASAAYDKALALAPDLAEAWLGRGNAFTELGRFGDALIPYEKSLALKPALAEAWLGLGNAVTGLDRYDDALAAYDQALALNPGVAQAWLGRANVFIKLKRYEDAFAAYGKALALKPDLDFAASHRLHAQLQLCDWENLAKKIAELLTAMRDGKVLCDPFVAFAIPSSPSEQLECAKRYVNSQPSISEIWRGEVYAHEPIRVAYLSADFHEHAVANLTVGLFEQHDRSRFEVTGISFGPDRPSAMRQRITNAFDRFVDVSGQSDEEVALLIRSLEIDIAIDLTGHTQNARTGIFARRPAPIAVNYLGYAGTMGAPYIDYIVADPIVVPVEHDEFYSEKVVRLPDSFMVNDATRPIARQVPARSLLHLPEAGFVFCCFNLSYKINPAMFEIWMRLLNEIEGSVFWLKDSGATATHNLRVEAERLGVAPERLIFAPFVPLAADHLAALGQADLFLDTLPYNGHATASDALWAGVPVITCLGSAFAGRVAASLLAAVGLPELITSSLEDYESLALKLARDPGLLAALKAKLSRNRNTYPLFDTKRFARNIEAAYAEMRRRHRRGEKPASFAVKANQTIEE